MPTIMGVFLFTVNTWDHRFIYSTLVFLSLLRFSLALLLVLS
jgi:hypothetical protein